VDEHVFAASLRLDKSIALGWIEPLHGAARHFDLPGHDPDDVILIGDLAAKATTELYTAVFPDSGGSYVPLWRRQRKAASVESNGINVRSTPNTDHRRRGTDGWTLGRSWLTDQWKLAHEDLNPSPEP
jgi:hypothetical protein